MASGHIFHILKCKTRFQAEKPASKYFGLFSSPIETAHSADVSPLPRLRIVHGIECEPPCAAIPAASQPSSCRQRSPPQRRRGGGGSELYCAEAAAVALQRLRGRGRRCSRAVAPSQQCSRSCGNGGGTGPGTGAALPLPLPPPAQPRRCRAQQLRPSGLRREA